MDFDNAQRDLSFYQLEKILSDIGNLGGERISLEGGEPLVRKDIGEIVDLIDDLGMECNINTNGFFLPGRGSLKHLTRVVPTSTGYQAVVNHLSMF